MNEKQAGLIALAIVKYIASRREFTINPSDDASDFAKRSSKKIGVDPEKMRQYVFQIILPVALNKHFGNDKVQIIGVPITLSQSEIEDISIRIIREESLDISPKTFRDRLDRMSKETSVNPGELVDFYLSYILPHTIAKIAGWKECQIIGKS